MLDKITKAEAIKKFNEGYRVKAVKKDGWSRFYDISFIHPYKDLHWQIDEFLKLDGRKFEFYY